MARVSVFVPPTLTGIKRSTQVPVVLLFTLVWRNSPKWAKAASFARFLDRTQWHITVGNIPLDERSDRPKTSTWQHKTLRRGKHSCSLLEFFSILFVLSLYFIRTCFLSDFPAFCLLCFALLHTTKISMTPAGFKPATPASDLPQIFWIFVKKNVRSIMKVFLTDNVFIEFTCNW
jgi:hypothetical protein